MRLRLRHASCALIMALLAVMRPSPLWAAERSALIQYIDLLPQMGSANLCRVSADPSLKPVQPAELPRMFAGAMGGSTVSIFQGLDQRCSFTLLIQPPLRGATRSDGFQKSLTIPKELDYSQSFDLTSTFLTGSESLGASSGSIVSFQHVDVGPGLTGPMPALFNSLYQRLSTLNGVQGFQVWTWSSRPNHWTVITSWRDQTSALAAQYDPTVMRIWSELYRNTAAPKHLSFYRLIKTN